MLDTPKKPPAASDSVPSTPNSEAQAKLEKAQPLSSAGKVKTENVVIRAANFQQAYVTIRGNAPLVVNNFSGGNRERMIAKQLEGSRAKKGQAREPKDFDALYKGALHYSTEGWYGFPASAFRAAMISACRMAGFAMTRAKLSIFVKAEGLDSLDGAPLVKIHSAAGPIRRDFPVRLADGSTDIVPRPFFDDWEIRLLLEWDGDQFSATDIIHLLIRAGKQVGIGAGRPDSKNSCGMGWGTFDVVTDA